MWARPVCVTPDAETRGQLSLHTEFRATEELGPFVSMPHQLVYETGSHCVFLCVFLMRIQKDLETICNMFLKVNARQSVVAHTLTLNTWEAEADQSL